VVIATILLIVIGVSAGLTLGARHKRLAAVDQPQHTGAASTTPAGSPTTGSATTGSPTTGSATPAGSLCTTHTQDVGPLHGTQGELTVMLKLVTEKSTVWICRDATGALFYHANRGGEFGPWVEGSTALFLTGVKKVDGVYVVTANDGVAIRISPQKLEVIHKDGSIETQKAVK